MGSKESKIQPLTAFDEPWRNVDWTKTEQMKTELTDIQVGHPDVRRLRILLHGPVGAGKSCFINSVYSVFQGRIKVKTHEESHAQKSCTKVCKAYTITNRNKNSLPFILNDLMGLEARNENGIPPEDVVNAVLGHMKDGYTLNPVWPLRDRDSYFIKEPNLNDKFHCLVSVVPASSISLMDDKVFTKMRDINKNNSIQDVPHVVILTKIDEACPLVKDNLKETYRSRKIKEKMQECSYKLGPPMKCIFPVSNYHEESETDNTKDVLILMALQQIVQSAKDYVENYQADNE